MHGPCRPQKLKNFCQNNKKIIEHFALKEENASIVILDAEDQNTRVFCKRRNLVHGQGIGSVEF